MQDPKTEKPESDRGGAKSHQSKGRDTRIRVPKDWAKERLDVAVSNLTKRPRADVQRWIRDGLVQVGQTVWTKPSRSLAGGEHITVAAEQVEVVAESRTVLELPVLFEDEHIVVINKPAGVLAHSNRSLAPGVPDDSVAGWARQRYDELPSLQDSQLEGDETRPGIVHRLDANTSGVMILARHTEAMQHLLEQFRERKVKKQYSAVVYGDPRFDSQYVEGEIARSKRHPERMEIVADGEGRPAETYYEVRERFGSYARVDCFPKTGRTHQIRVHLTSVGLPVVADSMYRRSSSSHSSGARANQPDPSAPKLQGEPPKLNRHALHAARIEFRHPVSGESVHFEAPLSDDLEQLLTWLRKAKKLAIEATKKRTGPPTF